MKNMIEQIVVEDFLIGHFSILPYASIMLQL
jgi:hypothetical protein